MSRYGRQTTSLVLYFNFHFFLSLFCYHPLPMVFSQLSSNQKSAMILLSNNLNTPTRVVSWDVNKEPNPCLWTGVRCNPPTNSSVIHISLSGYSLSSSDFLPLVCRIQSLQILDVSGNRLTTIPPGFILNCSKLGGLKLLNFSMNNLEGRLPYFVRFSGLEVLDFARNNLTGPIPPELGDCKNLALLNLAQNHLSGALPAKLGKLSSLEVLRLQSNNLSGGIPIQITQLPKLSILNISWNSLDGSIPPSVSNMQNLTNMNLQGNKLNGSIPASIAFMDSLMELQLGENHLSGDIPRMPMSLQIALNLSSNLFQGPIPETLSRLSNLEILDLSNNKFSGKIPDFFTGMKTLTQLLLSNNELSGEIPDFGSWVMVNTSGNEGVTNRTTKSSLPKSEKKGMSCAGKILVAIVSTVFVVFS
ncbi:hypothetical protein TB1_033602 [Malus domestica]